MTSQPWLIILVAVLTAGATLAGAWINGRSQARLARIEQENWRGEQDSERRRQQRREREDAYAKVLTSGRRLRDLSSGADAGAAQTAFAESAVLVELRAPTIADAQLPAVLDAAARLRAARTAGAARREVHEAVAGFDDALLRLRKAMRADLAADDG